MFAGLGSGFAARADPVRGCGSGGFCICVLGGEVWRLELVRQGVLVVVCSALSLLARQGGGLARRV